MLSDKKVRHYSSLLAPAPFVARVTDTQTVSGGCQSVALAMCTTLTLLLSRKSWMVMKAA